MLTTFLAIMVGNLMPAVAQGQNESSLLARASPSAAAL
jgi:hypothetical protein